MQKMEFEVEYLTAKLKENRLTHRGVYEQAIVEFRKQAESALQDMLVQLGRGKVFRLIANLPVPEDHTDDYDAVISMLENTTDRRLELDEHEYRQYVLDDWGWRASFTSNTASYLATS